MTTKWLIADKRYKLDLVVVYSPTLKVAQGFQVSTKGWSPSQYEDFLEQAARDFVNNKVTFERLEVYKSYLERSTIRSTFTLEINL